jgi:hypothetical protein
MSQDSQLSCSLWDIGLVDIGRIIPHGVCLISVVAKILKRIPNIISGAELHAVGHDRFEVGLIVTPHVRECFILKPIGKAHIKERTGQLMVFALNGKHLY